MLCTLFDSAQRYIHLHAVRGPPRFLPAAYTVYYYVSDSNYVYTDDGQYSARTIWPYIYLPYT